MRGSCLRGEGKLEKDLKVECDRPGKGEECLAREGSASDWGFH